jgi:CHAT domain-containing protein
VVGLLPPVAEATEKLENFAQCEAMVTKQPRATEGYDCYHTVAEKTQQWDEAIRRLEAARADEARRPWAALVLANIASRRGEARAEALYREAADGLGAAGDHDSEVYARLNLATSLSRSGRPADSDAELARAVEVAEASGDARLRAMTRIQRAQQLRLWGREHHRAYQLARQVEAEVFPDGPYQLRTATLFVLAGLGEDRGRGEEALHYLERLAEQARAEKDLLREAAALAHIVRLRMRFPSLPGPWDVERAKQMAREALEKARAITYRESESDALCSLGHLTEGPESDASFEQCIAILRELEAVKQLTRSLAGYALQKPSAEGIALADEALRMARRSGFPWGMARALASRAALRWRVSSREYAVEDGLELLDAVEAIRDRQKDDVARALVFSEWSFAYYQLAGRLLLPEAGEPDALALEQGFRVVERMRARILLEALDQADAVSGLRQEGTLHTARDQILDQIAEVQRQLLQPKLSAEAREALLVKLAQHERDEAALREQLIQKDANFARLRKPTIPSLMEARAALKHDEALISFQLAAQDPFPKAPRARSWAMVVTRGGTRIYPLPERAEVETGVALFQGLVDARDGSEAAAAPRLHQMVLGPILKDLPERVTRLVLVPDGALHRLPFAALRSEEKAEPLGVRYRLSVVPSVSLWLQWRTYVATRVGPLLALADPELPGQGEAVQVAERAWPLQSGQQLSPLPYARTEAEAAVGSLGEGSELHVGAKASEALLKSIGLGRFGLLHLAAHALHDEAFPERSAVVLAPGGTHEDGLLQMREVVGLELANKVVVLSACRSATGEVLEGEGVLGLGRAFFQGGARTVVGSLWPLRDDEAAELFEGFYDHLGRGLSAAEALRAAQEEAISRGAPAAAWAGVVLLGDGDVVPRPDGRGSSRSLTVAGLALAALAAGAWVMLARQRRKGVRPG